jgi:VanZ family protein
LRVRRWLPPLIWAGVILVATSLPGSLIPPALSPFDKVVHFTMYGVFGALLAREASFVMGTWRAALIGVLLASAFGAADEWHQRFIPNRSTELADWQADSLGALVGALGVAAYRSARTARGK